MNLDAESTARARLVSELREHALVIGEVTLTSGATAQYLVDAKRAILLPAGFHATLSSDPNNVFLNLALNFTPPPPGPGPKWLPPPLGPTLSCSDFKRNADGTWSATHQMTITAGGQSNTLWPTAHFGSVGFYISGVDIAPIVDKQCGGH